MAKKKFIDANGKVTYYVGYDCRNCDYHWVAPTLQESCPACNSWAVNTTDEWGFEDACENAMFRF